jgi:hypothetical protein
MTLLNPCKENTIALTRRKINNKYLLKKPLMLMDDATTFKGVLV